MPQGKGTYGSKRGRPPKSGGGSGRKSTMRKSRTSSMGIKKKKNTKGGKGYA